MDAMMHERKISDDVARLLDGIAGKPCTRKAVGRMRSLSLGFGTPAHPKTKPSDVGYREWEIGSYRSAWRVLRGEALLCASQDVVDSIEEFDHALARIDFGRFSRLWQPTEFDVRVELDNGIAVDFLATVSDEDESFHIFCPGDLYVELSARTGWRTGPSNGPWSGSD
jgi:hypothetical protein